MKIFKVRLVFASITAIIMLWIFIYLTGHSASNDIRYFKYDALSSVYISDRGLVGDKMIKINYAGMASFSKLLQESTPIDYDTINWKANQGLCEIKLEFEDQKTKTLILTNTTLNGSLISIGDFHYKNDSLKNLVLNMLLTKN